MQNKDHKTCVMGCKNKLNGKYNCLRESPIFRDGKVHLIDLECHTDNPSLKPVAVECECGSGKLQRESNRLDLLEWKKKNPTGETFQFQIPKN